MNKGLFITFEGADGSGKSTQIKLLAKHLEEQGYDFMLTREPGGVPISEKIRAIILDNKNSEMNYMTEALLYAASRAQNVSDVIKPNIEKGRIVLCDRFMDSSIAYQGYGRRLGDCVRIINEYAVMGTQPDLTFFIDISPEKGMARCGSRGEADRLEKEALDFHKSVYEGYKEIAEIYKDRYAVIDGDRPIDVISKEICELFDRYAAERIK